MAERKTKSAPVPISGLAHIGIRVHELERSVRFYALLGFTKTAGPIGPEPVAILDHPSGVELNLVLNAPSPNEANVLMDVADKHPGITHFALLCPDIMAAKEQRADRAKERCRLNHGVDCDTPEGLKEWLLQERSRQEAIRDGSRRRPATRPGPTTSRP